jgi:uncharacterized repeat protein (TIGR02543 family)
MERKALIAIAVLAVFCSFAAVLSVGSDESDAFGNHGTSSSPLSSLSLDGYDCAMDSNKDYYVYVGSSVSIVCEGDGGGLDEFAYNITGVTSGYGLTYNSSYYNPGCAGEGKVSGTISKAGNISVSYDGWNGTNDYNGSITIHAIAQQSSSHTYYLRYDANGGSGAPSTQSWTGTTSSHSFTVASGTPTKSGYTFKGWDTQYSASTVRYTAGQSISVSWTADDGDVTLYAVWEKNATSYTCYLYYNANGGSGAPSTQSYTGTSTSSHSFTVASGTPTRSGYTFLGWSTSSSATSATYQAGNSISVTYNGSKTLYAVWQQNVTNYQITIYKGNWDSFKLLGVDNTNVTSSSKTYTIASGTSIDVDWYGKAAENGSGVGYTYTTTYTSSNYNMASSLYGTSLGDSVTVTKKASYYPAVQMESSTVYTYNYTIKYSANGGSGAPSDTTTTASSSTKTIQLSSSTPTRSGYQFLGWSKSSTATSATYSAGSSYSFDYGTTQLYAVWKQLTITVSGTPDQYAVVGSYWSFSPTVSVSGCSVSISGAPWLSSTGTTVSGTPTQTGTYDITLTFSKSGYTSATKTFTVTVISSLEFTSSPSGGAIIYAV